MYLLYFILYLDFKKLMRAFDRHKLEGASLKICPVPISNCIIVANLASDITKDTIEFYFQNKRKSGGGQVDRVVMNDDDTCFVYFADYTGKYSIVIISMPQFSLFLFRFSLWNRVFQCQRLITLCSSRAGVKKPIEICSHLLSTIYTV
jgi:hypothetical protein